MPQLIPIQPDRRKPTDMVPLPFMDFEPQPMRVFSPDDPELCAPMLGQGPLTYAQAVKVNPKLVLTPRPEDCRIMWQEYGMLSNIKAHSEKVAVMVLGLAQMRNARGEAVDADAAYAAGLLHDLGKTYTIHNRGNHAQIGAAWAMRETRNPVIANAVALHVHFPWEDQLEECLGLSRYFITLAVIYADKRVKHDVYVSLEERFEDLNDRYGVNGDALKRIEQSYLQGKTIEDALSNQLEVELYAYTPDYGRMVR